MAEFVTLLTSVFTALVGFAGDIGAMVMSTPILAFAVVIPLAGAGVGLFSRLLHIGR